MSAPQFSFLPNILKNIKKLAPKKQYLPRELNDKFNQKEMLKYVEDRRKAGWKTTRTNDIIEQLGLDVRREYRNTSLLSGFVNQMGMIRPRTETALSKRNQKLIGKAIRRARSMGFLPYTYQLP